MHILKVPSFFLAKKMGGSIKRGARPDPALADVLIQLPFTSENYIGNILYYLLAGVTELGSKSILYFVALSGGVPGFTRISLNSLHINSQREGSIPGTLVLSPPPNYANTPLVSNNG